MMEYYRDAWYRQKSYSGGHERMTLYSWGDKNVKLALGHKLLPPRQISRDEFEREWELVDPRPFDQPKGQPIRTPRGGAG